MIPLDLFVAMRKEFESQSDTLELLESRCR